LDARKINKDIVLPKFTDKTIKEIIEKIYEPQYGARPLERYIQETIEPEIINKLINK
jgi:ATP-dependent Clp protease ATP-binding subunit ClpA